MGWASNAHYQPKYRKVTWFDRVMERIMVAMHSARSVW